MAAGTNPDYLRKAPGTVRNYYVNFGRFAELAVDGETLTGTPTIAAVSGLTFGTGSISGTKVVFSISGGTAGTEYQLTVTVSTSGGSTLQCRPLLRVEAM